MGWYFGFFFLSGFCSILYELIWLRLTMAQYGVTSVLSRETSLDNLIDLSPETPALTDNRPINEYYLLRAIAAAQHPAPR